MVCAGIVQRSTVQCGIEEENGEEMMEQEKDLGLSMSIVSNLCNFFANDDRVFFPDFLSRVSFIVEGAIVEVWVSVNTAKHISTAAVKTCDMQINRNK